MGALLAQRFKVVVLLPALLVIAVVAFGAAVEQGTGVALTVLTIVVASVSIQVGYFLGMLIRRGVDIVHASKSSAFPQTRSARDPVR